MNKNKQKTWVIGYVKLPSEFDLADPIEHAKAYHFTNLQPMWEEDVPEMEDFETAYLAEVRELVRGKL